MARLPRLVIPGLPHYVLVRGQGSLPILIDDADRLALRTDLLRCARAHEVALHAFAVLPQELHLLATPSTPVGLSRVMQALGRHYVAWYNRRHGRSGALWDRRFRAAVVEPGERTLQAMICVDSLDLAAPRSDDDAPAVAAADALHSSTPHHLGLQRDPGLSDPPEYWQLGNTPFERESRYADLLHAGHGQQLAQRLRQAAASGWVVGSPPFIERLSAETSRPLSPRPAGRPRQRRTESSA